MALRDINRQDVISLFITFCSAEAPTVFEIVGILASFRIRGRGGSLKLGAQSLEIQGSGCAKFVIYVLA